MLFQAALIAAFKALLAERIHSHNATAGETGPDVTFRMKHGLETLIQPDSSIVRA